MRRFEGNPIPFVLVSLLSACGGGLPPGAAEGDVRAAIARFAAEPPAPQTHATRVRRSSTDNAGDVHVFFDTLRNGHRVLGAERARHVRRDGTVVNQDFADTSRLRFDDTPAVLSEAQAADLARAAMSDLHARARSARPELLYEREGDTYRLVYAVDVALDPREPVDPGWQVWVDAARGQVLRRENVTRHSDGTGRSYFYGNVPLKTTVTFSRRRTW